MRLDLRDALRSRPTARRLSPRFDAVPLQAALAALDEGWWHPHAGPYNERGWESVALWAPRGDPNEQTSRGGVFSATPVLLRSPAFASVLDHFSAERNRVRLMRLQPGGKILRHSDPMHTIDSRLVRLHVPVTTNPDVRFEVNDRRITMQPGETWHVDVRFPHAVENRGPTARVHLVIDLMRNEALDALLAAGDVVDTGWLTRYVLGHSLPAAVRQAFRIGN